MKHKSELLKFLHYEKLKCTLKIYTLGYAQGVIFWVLEHTVKWSILGSHGICLMGLFLGPWVLSQRIDYLCKLCTGLMFMYDPFLFLFIWIQTSDSRWRRTAVAIDEVSRLIFPLGFLVFNVSYWFYFLSVIQVK